MGEAVGGRFPEFLGFMLDNPIRRLLERPEAEIRGWGLVDGAVLEVGCGPGFFTIPLAGKNRRVVAFDLSAGFLSSARRKAEGEGLENVFLLRCEASRIPLKDGLFDRAFIHFVYHEVNERDVFIDELARLLKDGGEVVMVEVEPATGLGKLFGPPGAASGAAKMKFAARFRAVELSSEGGRRYTLRARK